MRYLGGRVRETTELVVENEKMWINIKGQTDLVICALYMAAGSSKAAKTWNNSIFEALGEDIVELKTNKKDVADWRLERTYEMELMRHSNTRGGLSRETNMGF